MPSSEENIGESFLIRAIKWGLNHPQGFSVSEVTEATELSLSDREKDVLKTYLQIAHKNHYSIGVTGAGPVNPDTLFLALYILDYNNYADGRNKYVISLESHFNFIDYQELRLARKNAKDAKISAFIAIAISVLAILIPVLTTQDIEVRNDVKIDNNQLEQILNTSNNVKINEQQLGSLLSAMEDAKVSDQQIKSVLETLAKIK